MNIELKIIRGNQRCLHPCHPRSVFSGLNKIYNQSEFDNLRSQIGISSWGGTRYMPMVFTEQGVAILSSVLNSNKEELEQLKKIGGRKLRYPI